VKINWSTVNAIPQGVKQQ